MVKDIKYLVWLSTIFEPGNKKINRLLNYFENAENIYKAEFSDLNEVSGLTENDIDKIHCSKKEFDIDNYIDTLCNKNISFMSKSSTAYPKLLKKTDDPPSILYYIGTFPEDDTLKISIIGSRKCSEYGRIMAYKISKELAEREVVIVSGMARGIDAMAHKGCIEGGAKTIAVLGCGVDICYPAENRSLYDRISQNGCILSEYPPGTVAKPRFFPVRNRIISGLSPGTVVIEAGKRSGTSITANLSLDYGREVMAVPGNATSPYSAGTNQLIKDGAALVTCGEDVLGEMGIVEKHKKKTSNSIENILAPKEKLVYDCMSLIPASADELWADTRLEIKELQSVLTMLEIKKHIKRLPGQKFIRSI